MSKRKHKPGWSRSGLTAFAAAPGKIEGRPHVDEKPTSPDIAAHIGRLVGEMHWLADLMKVHGGFEGKMLQHAEELHGAADIVNGWAEGIRNQTEGATSSHIFPTHPQTR